VAVNITSKRGEDVQSNKRAAGGCAIADLHNAECGKPDGGKDTPFVTEKREGRSMGGIS